jgi:hypothetical protein
VVSDEKVREETNSKGASAAEQPEAALAETSADEQGVHPEKAESVAAGPPPARRRTLSRLIFLVCGLLVALYLGTQGPQEQHVRVVLGAAAPEVTEVGVQYISKGGDVAREAHFSFPKGAAPRVVPHEAQLPNGDYRLQIEIDARDVRRTIQRQVTLGGGSTQIDVSSALATEDKPHP